MQEEPVRVRSLREDTSTEAHRMPRERQCPPVEDEQDGEDFFDD